MQSFNKGIFPFLFGIICAMFCIFMEHGQLEDEFLQQHHIFYLNLSRSIFQPQDSYYAESFLLPLLARFFNASDSMEAFKVFHILIFVIGMGFFSQYLYAYVKSRLIFAVTMLILFWTLLGFRHMYWGHPDALLYPLLLLSVITKNKFHESILYLVCLLAHFPLALVSILSYRVLFENTQRKAFTFKFSKWKDAFRIVLIIVLAKFCLLLWFSVFDYDIPTRWEWAFDRMDIFYDRFSSHSFLSFLFKGSGSNFVYVNIAIFVVNLSRRRLSIAIGQLIVLFISYVVMYFTLDGFRTFTVSIIASYLFGLFPEIRGKNRPGNEKKVLEM